MTVAGWGLILAFVGLLVLLAKPAGLWLHRVYTADRPGRVERGLYRVAGVNAAHEQGWLA